MSDILQVFVDNMPTLLPMLSTAVGTVVGAAVKHARRMGFAKKAIFVIYCDVPFSQDLISWLAEQGLQYEVHIRRLFQRAGPDVEGVPKVHVVVHRSVLVRALTTAVSLGSTIFDDYGSKARYSFKDLQFLVLQSSRRKYESCDKQQN